MGDIPNSGARAAVRGLYRLAPFIARVRLLPSAAVRISNEMVSPIRGRTPSLGNAETCTKIYQLRLRLALEFGLECDALLGVHGTTSPTPDVAAQGRCAALSRSAPWSEMLGVDAIACPIGKRYFQDNAPDSGLERPMKFSRGAACVMSGFEPQIKCLVVEATAQNEDFLGV